MIGFELVKDGKTKKPACQEVEVFMKEGIKKGVIFGGEVEKVLKTVKEITEKISNGK